jgi:hypothetical protein
MTSGGFIKEGSEYAGAVTLGRTSDSPVINSVTTGDILEEFIIDPPLMVQGGALSCESLNWDQYEILEMALTYVPCCSEFQAGTLWGIEQVDPDSSNMALDGGDSTLKLLSSREGAVEFPVRTAAFLPIRSNKNYLFNHNQDDIRENVAGKYLIVAGSNINVGTDNGVTGNEAGTGMTIGHLWLHYKVRFTQPIVSSIKPNTKIFPVSAVQQLRFDIIQPLGATDPSNSSVAITTASSGNLAAVYIRAALQQAKPFFLQCSVSATLKQSDNTPTDNTYFSDQGQIQPLQHTLIYARPITPEVPDTSDTQLWLFDNLKDCLEYVNELGMNTITQQGTTADYIVFNWVKIITITNDFDNQS